MLKGQSAGRFTVTERFLDRKTRLMPTIGNSVIFANEEGSLKQCADGLRAEVNNYCGQNPNVFRYHITFSMLKVHNANFDCSSQPYKVRDILSPILKERGILRTGNC